MSPHSWSIILSNILHFSVVSGDHNIKCVTILNAVVCICLARQSPSWYLRDKNKGKVRWRTKWTHTMKYYSSFKSNEILTHNATWVIFRDIILSRIDQIQKDNFVWFHIYGVPRVVKFIMTESRMVAPRAWSLGGKVSSSLIITNFQLGRQKVLKMNCGDGCITVLIFLMPLNCTHKNS